jgi:hypothetical protein
MEGLLLQHTRRDEIDTKSRKIFNNLIYCIVTIPLYAYILQLSAQLLSLTCGGFYNISDMFESHHYNYNLCISNTQYRMHNIDLCRETKSIINTGFMITFVEYISNGVKLCGGMYCSDIIHQVSTNTPLTIIGISWLFLGSWTFLKQIWNYIKHSDTRKLQKIIKTQEAKIINEEEEEEEEKFYIHQFPKHCMPPIQTATFENEQEDDDGLNYYI